MQRRSLIFGATATILLPACGGGDGAGDQLANVNRIASCNVSANIAIGARVELNALFQQAAQIQYQNLWCWAACISMIFSYRGHPVSQARIVTEAYGQPYNMAGPGYVIAQSLNRPWRDDAGKVFNSTLSGVYDYYDGVGVITDGTIVNSLAGGTPMVIGAGGHARVLVEVDYIPTPTGPQIVGGGVFDPWTGTLQCLSVAELTLASRGGTLTFLAAVRIS
jgi:Papain-like cysteine protease AvrRpt2